MTSPAVGVEAPDFTLPDQNRQDVTLSSFRGVKNVLVAFYPFAFSGICTGEMCQVRDDLPSFENDDVQFLGVSVDHTFALKAWSVAEGFTFPLLSDFWPHGEVAKRYGVFQADRGMAVRGTFLVDRGGILRFVEVNAPGEARYQDGWKKALAAVA